ncbi:hypothetical protein [Sphingosinicella soli]|uniref:Uncharacterized protein n=1 Tax=Sphingosinicella soli TaxID=333708 RepID=A0A7W7B2H8_9SPHN|nr:hypothetical protein [Sphingosinicella soli]MBB4631908.1 hypothetical protein [Sphingosinicella soli]
MKVYIAIRDWVDRQWRAPGLRFKILLLPAMLPLLLIPVTGNTPTLTMTVCVWFIGWNLFVFWRYWIFLKVVSRKADEQYDKVGKFNLANEYHDTESATAAGERKRRG